MAPEGRRQLTADQRRMLLVLFVIAAAIGIISIAIGALAVSLGLPLETGILIAVIICAAVTLFMFLSMV